MKRSVTVLDTCMLAVHLKIPEYASCGPASDRWDYKRIDRHLKDQEARGGLFVMPLAAVLETANHIANSNGNRFLLANELRARVVSAIDGDSPWIAFSDQTVLWAPPALRQLLDDWPPHASRAVSLSDHSIANVALFYATLGHPVEILTGDKGLKSMEPAPRRHARRRR